jgi:hypothetical protein
MKFALLVGFLLGVGIQTNAREPAYKSWKTFKSDVGYQLKYPSCWEIHIDWPDEDGPLEKVRHISVDEGPSCATKQLSEDIYRNGIGIVGGSGPKQKKSEAIKEIEFRKKFAQGDVARGDDFVFKHFKLGDADAITWVEKNSSLAKDIRWQTKVYCPDWWISITGPAIDEPNIDKSMFEKFKKGDLALPEPYKTMINSFRCIPATQKEDPD